MSTSLNENKKPFLLGLTGGIGSGKSTVAKIFLALGIPVFNSDDEAKSIVNTDEDVKQKIKAEFGEVYLNGKLDRAKMAAIVFNNAEALKKLNGIVHPAVGKKFKTWVVENNNKPILIKEAAILIESGAYKEMDKIVLVKASEETRINRVVKRNNVSEGEVKERMKNQLSDGDKAKYCDFVIDNEDQMLIPQVIEIIRQIKKP